METRLVGSSGLRVSRLGLGTMTWGRDTSGRALLRDLDGSLDRLGTDYVDLWQIHAYGEAPLAETLDAMDHAVRSGRVRYAGVSNFVGWQTAQAATWQLAFPGRTQLASAQVEYSLLARRGEGAGLPAP